MAYEKNGQWNGYAIKESETGWTIDKWSREQGGIAPSKDYELIPQWCKRSAGMALDVMVGELSQVGYPVQDANGLYQALLAM